MAKFIRVGNKAINIETVTEVVINDDREFIVRFDAIGNYSKFSGEEADALRWYFKNESNDIVSDYRVFIEKQETEALPEF